MRVIETQIKDPQMSLWQMEMWSLEVGVPWPKSEIYHFLPLFLNLALFFFVMQGIKILVHQVKCVLPKSALRPHSSGRKRRSTAHTRMWSGTLRDFTPTSRNPGGTSKDSVAMDKSRRSLPAWQNPEMHKFVSGHTVTLWPYWIT